ncbi:Gypsy retrotransposon integrase-like protein 1 [Marasmius tenuissimus]|uniref:Gypsy retrotransposon integrase-like protein 1 n=1 Tax=Marasmius tenuissimus TaxID=585030 RepID=A0ABR3A240_9AGAR
MYVPSRRSTPRGTKNVQCLVRSILSTSRPYVVPENPEDTRLILTELANCIVYLEDQLEALQKRERNQQNSAADSPESSTTNTSPILPTTNYYTPAYKPAYVENGDVRNLGGAKEEDADSSTADLVNAVVNQLAVSTGSVLPHSQTGALEQHLKEPEGGEGARGETSTSGPGTGNAWPYGKGQEPAKTPARGKRKEFWSVLSVGPQFPFLSTPGTDIFAFYFSGSFDLPLPLACDDEYWAWEEQVDGSPDQEFKQPEDKPSRMIYWVTFLKLLDIMGFAHKNLYAVRRNDMWARNGATEVEWNEKIVAELDSALNAWIDIVPGHLKWNPNSTNDPGYNLNEPNPFFHQSTVLYVTYYWAQMIVHKPFLSTIPSPVSSASTDTPISTTTAPGTQVPGWRFPSMAICTNAAKSVVSLVEIAQRRECLRQGNECRPPLSTTITAVISSAIILFVNVWRGKGSKNQSTSNSLQHLGDVFRCFEILKRWEHTSQSAGRLCDILNGLLPAYGLPSSSSIGPHLARGTRRGRGENDEGEETSDAHCGSSGEVQNPNLTRMMAAHPRPIIGSRRVANSNFATPDSQEGEGSNSAPDSQMHDSGAQSYPLQQPQFQPPHVSQNPHHDQFTLLLGSDELGGLVRPTIDRSFVHDYGLGNSTSESSRPIHSSMHPNPYQDETSFWHVGGGHAANAYRVKLNGEQCTRLGLSKSIRTGTSLRCLREWYVAREPPPMYERHLNRDQDPEVFDSSYGAQPQVPDGGFSTNVYDPGCVFTAFAE